MASLDLKDKLSRMASRESYIWLCVEDDLRVMFGWIIKIDGDYLVFKDDELRGIQRVKIAAIEDCGVV